MLGPIEFDEHEDELGAIMTTPIRVGVVEVTGQQRTDVDFIHSEFNFDGVAQFGDVVEACQQAHQDLTSLGIFQSVAVELEKGEVPGEVDVFVRVVEKGLLQVSTGTEIDSNESSAKVEGTLRNVFGRGESVRLGGRYGAKSSTSFEATLHKPRLYGTRGTLDADVFAGQQNNVMYHSHMLESRGISLRVLDPTGSISFGYEGCWRDVVLPVEKEPSPSIARESLSSVKSSLKAQYLRDSRDVPMNAFSGSFLQIQDELALPYGGDVTFAKTELNAQYHLPLFSFLSLGVSVKGGAMYPFNLGKSSKSWAGDRTFISDRFQYGGPLALRGFGVHALGPRDGTDALGGELLLAARTSLRLSLPHSLLNHYHITAHIFANCGNLVSLTDGSVLSRQARNLVSDMRVSAGVGIVIPSPVGRIEFNYCRPIVAFANDRTAAFQFGISNSFL